MLTFQVLCLVASVTGMPEQPAIHVVQVPGDISNQNSTLVRGVSGDGRVVVGQSFHNVVSNRQSALIWTQPNGSSSFAAADATAVNYDGTVVVGRKRVSAEGAYRWSSSGGFVTLPDFDGQTKSTALGVSGDGNYTIGYAQYDTVTLRHIRVARWDAQGGLDLRIGNTGPMPGAINFDGSAYTYHKEEWGGLRSYLYTGHYLDRLPIFDGWTDTAVVDMNDSGDVMFGTTSRIDPGTGRLRQLASVWRGFDEVQPLAMPVGALDSSTTCANQAGAVIAGRIIWADGSNRMVFWTDQGVFDAIDVWTASGIDLSGWSLSSMTIADISADGSTVVGNGTFNGFARGFVITGLTIPSPSAAALLGSAPVFCLARRRRTAP